MVAVAPFTAPAVLCPFAEAVWPVAEADEPLTPLLVDVELDDAVFVELETLVDELVEELEWVELCVGVLWVTLLLFVLLEVQFVE